MAQPARPDRALPARRRRSAVFEYAEAGSQEEAAARRSREPPSRAADLRQRRRRRRSAARVGDKDRPTKTVPGKIGGAQQLGGDSYINGGRARRASSSATSRSRSASGSASTSAGTAGPLVTRSGGLFNGNRGYEVILRADGTLTAGLHHVAPDNSIEIETDDAGRCGRARGSTLTLTYDGSSRAAGIGLFVDGQLAPARVLIDHLRRSIIYDAEEGQLGRPAAARLGRRHDETLEGVTVDDLRVFDRQLTTFEAAALGGVADPLGDGAGDAGGARARRRSRRRCASTTCCASIRAYAHAARRRSPPCAARRTTLLTSLTEVMIDARARRRRGRRSSWRAAPTTRRPSAVTPGTPHALGDFPAALPANRLGLARWLRRPVASADRAGDGQPLLGAALRPRPRRHARRLRQPGPPADAPGAARLAGDDVRRVGLGSEGAAEAHRACRRPIGSRRLPMPQARERDPANEWLARGPSLPAVGRADPRRARSPTSGLLVRDDRRTERLSVSAGRLVGSARHAQRDDLRAGAGRRSLSAQPLHGVEAIVAAAVGDQLRRRRAPVLHGEPAADQHAAAGAGAARTIRSTSRRRGRSRRA